MFGQLMGIVGGVELVVVGGVELVVIGGVELVVVLPGWGAWRAERSWLRRALFCAP